MRDFNLKMFVLMLFLAVLLVVGFSASVYAGLVPIIIIEKSTNGDDADDPPGPSIVVGNAVSWAYEVTNRGDVALENVTVVDNQGVAISCPTDMLTPGGIMICEGSGIALLGPYANVGTVTAVIADNGLDEEISDEDPSHYLGVECISNDDCEDTDDNVCTTAGCNDVGECDQAHIINEGNPCVTADDGLACTTAGCNAAGECDPVYFCVPDDCDIFVGDFVWEDINGDGVQDAGEPGCEGSTVWLNNGADCLTTDVDSDVTDAFGEYGFRVATVDAACVPLTDVDVSIRVDLTGSSCEGFDGSPKDTTTDDFDSDCDPATGVTDCRQDLTQDDLDIDCGYEREIMVFCRSAGFWGARGGNEKDGFNYTQAAIDAGGGCLNVCGVDICESGVTAADIGNLGNALEAMCMRSNDPEQQNQLFRQMTAAALNCATSGDPSCSFLDGAVGTSPGLKGITWAECTASCIAGADDPIARMCVDQIGCFNKGGYWDEILGCQPLGDCVDVAGNMTPNSCFDADDCFGDVGPYECVDNCHVENFCNVPTADYFDVANDFLDCIVSPENLGPASSPKLCRMANRNDCTIADDAVCDTNECIVDPACGQLATGACCLPGAVCEDWSESECDSNGGLYLGDGVSCALCFAPSDLSLKKDIEPLRSSLDKVLELQGVTFNWKTDEYPDRGFSEDRQIGFIAQDVERVFPELVRTGKNGYRAVSYSNLTAVLVEAIKALQIQNKDLQRQIEELRALSGRSKDDLALGTKPAR